uniref:Uncharacterized protein n=1 Tax=Romanomermis culicivorax TaxID=13658 RepID=A0A915I787_ROMCU
MQRVKPRLQQNQLSSFGPLGQSYGQQPDQLQMTNNLGAPPSQQQSSIMMNNNRFSDSGQSLDQQAANQLTLLKSLLTDLLRLLERYSSQSTTQSFGPQQGFDGSLFNSNSGQQSGQFQVSPQQQQNQPAFIGQPHFDFGTQQLQQPPNIQTNVFDSVQNSYRYQGQSSQPQPSRNIYTSNNGDGSGSGFVTVGQPRQNFGQQQQQSPRPQSNFGNMNNYVPGNGNEYGMQAPSQQDKPQPQQLVLQNVGGQPVGSSSLQMQPNVGGGQPSGGGSSSLQNEILQNYNSLQSSGGLFQPPPNIPQGQNSQQQQVGQGNNMPQSIFDLAGLPSVVSNANSNQGQMGLKAN